MSLVLQVNQVGPVEFPDDATAAEIQQALARDFARLSPSAEARFAALDYDALRQPTLAPPSLNVPEWRPRQESAWWEELRAARERLSPLLGLTERQMRMIEAASGGHIPASRATEATGQVGLKEALAKPTVSLPHLPRAKTLPGQIVSGIGNGVIGLAESFTSPLGLATMAMSAVPRAIQGVTAIPGALRTGAEALQAEQAVQTALAAQRAVAAGFAADILSGVPLGWHAMLEQARQGDIQEAVKAGTDMSLSALLGSLAAGHAANARWAQLPSRRTERDAALAPADPAEVAAWANDGPVGPMVFDADVGRLTEGQWPDELRSLSKADPEPLAEQNSPAPAPTEIPPPGFPAQTDGWDKTPPDGPLALDPDTGRMTDQRLPPDPGLTTGVQREAPPLPRSGLPAQATSPVAADEDPVHRLWKTIASSGASFRYGEKFDASRPEDIARHLSTEESPITGEVRNGVVRFSSPHGYIEVLEGDQGSIEINAEAAGSQGRKDGQGKQLYQAALAYAVNNKLKADPYGRHAYQDSISEINGLRRTLAMLSSALRFGTTRHLEPAWQQGLTTWETGNDAGNIRAMAHRIADWSTEAFPWLKELRYEPHANQFKDQAGRVWTDEDLETRLAMENPSHDKGVGLTTAKFSILTRSAPALAEELGTGFEDQLLKDLGHDSLTDPLLYAPPEPEPARPAAAKHGGIREDSSVIRSCSPRGEILEVDFPPGDPRSCYDPERDQIVFADRDASRTETVIEEVAHALTAWKVPEELLKGDEATLRAALRDGRANGAIRRLIEGYLLAKATIKTPSHELNGLGEFMAGLFRSRPLQRQLAALRWTASGPSVWQKTIQALRVLLHLNTDAEPLLARVLHAAAELVHAERLQRRRSASA